MGGGGLLHPTCMHEMQPLLFSFYKMNIEGSTDTSLLGILKIDKLMHKFVIHLFNYVILFHYNNNRFSL